MSASDLIQGEAIHGDPRRQAVASLRGYAYQLYASALAWLSVEAGSQLHLEVAEDYAILTRNALEAVQVRDNLGSGALTIRSAGAHQTIGSFVDLSRRNPRRRLSIRYLTTARIGIERAEEDRAAGEPSLQYWRRAAAGADVEPLRRVMQGLGLPPETVTFINERDDETLRRELLQRIHWDCGATDLAGLKHELEAGIFQLGQSRFGGLTSSEIQLAAADVVHTVLDAIVGASERVLTAASLNAVLERTANISVARRDLEALMRRAESAAGFARAVGFRAEGDTPLPQLMAPRTDDVAALAARVRGEGLAFACGATGMGKTLTARLATRVLGGQWIIADFAGLDATQSVERLHAVLGAIAVTPVAGVVLDDLNEAEVPEVSPSFARLRSALQRRDARCLVTAYRRPAARLRSELGVSPNAVQDIGDLSEQEVAALIESAGGAAARWSRAVYIATAGGHPQLTQATIADLQWRGWPEEELCRLYELDTSGLDLAAQRKAARKRLVDTAPSGARTLLNRLSLLIGSFRREIALALARTSPAILDAGEHLDALTGPWIDVVGSDRLRLSPLLSDAGTNALTRDEQMRLHSEAAELLLAADDMDVQDASSGLAHALIARTPEPLRRLAIALLSASSETRTSLARWFGTLEVLPTDRPIFPEDLELSRLLRLAQVLIVAVSTERRSLADTWGALQSEIAEESDGKTRERLELMVLTKVLLERRMVELPTWIALLARLAELLDIHPDLVPGRGGMKLENPTAFLLTNLALGLRSVAGLVDCFRQLDSLPAAQRTRLLAPMREKPAEIGHFINNPWISERSNGEVDGRRRAQTYDQLASLAAGWGERALAVRCHVAKSIMLDEYAKDEASALRALHLAERELGADVAITRARAKVAFRSKRYGDALALLRQIAEAPMQDGVERAFLCREAAISATEVGEQEEGLIWFKRAAAALDETRSDSLKAMQVGLEADAALAEFRCGRTMEAIVALWDTLKAARDIDPLSSLKATYLHKTLGHASLWLNGQVTYEKYDVADGYCIAPPGMCSNPEPSEEIRTLPRASIEGSQYLLAAADIYLGGSLGLDAALEHELRGHHIFTLESQRRFARLDRALAAVDFQTLPNRIAEGLEAACLGIRVMQERRGEPAAELPLVEGAFPRLPEPERQDLRAVSYVNDAFFALEVLADLQGVSGAESQIRRAAETLASLGYASPTYHHDASTRQSQFAGFWRHTCASETLSADDLFATGLRMLEWAVNSVFKGAVLPALGEWAAHKWVTVIETQRFRLRNPSVSVPAIEVALSADIPQMDRLAVILDAARLAFKYNLSPELLAMLKTRS